jgi:hypothetical protein
MVRNMFSKGKTAASISLLKIWSDRCREAITGGRSSSMSRYRLFMGVLINIGIKDRRKLKEN